MATSTAPAARSRMAGSAPAPARRKRRIPGAQKIKAKELPAFTRQLGAMLSAGLPVVQTLEALEEQNTNKVFQHVIAGVKSRIEGGASFSEALAQYPDIFDELYISMLRAGESGGMLAETTARIATFLEGWVRLKRKVKSAMMYPVIVLVVALLITSSLIIWIVPIFASIYADFGAKLPGPTQWLMNVSTAMRENALFVVAGIAVAAIALGQYKKTAQGAYVWDGLKLKLPVIGELVRKISLARFSSTFAQLTRSGVPILQTMEIVAFATGNKVLGKIILDARTNVERGEPLSMALEKSRAYPRLLIHMLSAGEKTGRVDEMLAKIADFYNDEVETTLAGLTSLIEPLLIVFLGVMIGGIVVCMFMPIFKMHEIVGF